MIARYLYVCHTYEAPYPIIHSFIKFWKRKEKKKKNIRGWQISVYIAPVYIQFFGYHFLFCHTSWWWWWGDNGDFISICQKTEKKKHGFIALTVCDKIRFFLFFFLFFVPRINSHRSFIHLTESDWKKAKAQKSKQKWRIFTIWSHLTIHNNRLVFF